MEQEILTPRPFADVQSNDERQGNLLQNYERRFENLPEDQKLSKVCSEASLNLIEVGQFFYALPSPNGANNQSSCREYTLPRDDKENGSKRRIESDAWFGPVLEVKVCKTHGRYSVEVQVLSLFEDQSERGWKVRHKGNADLRRRKSFGETRCKGETNVETVINKQLELDSDGIEKMDRHWSEKIQGPSLFPDVKMHYSMSSTHGSWSRRRWRSSLWSSSWEMQEVLWENSRCWSHEINRKSKYGSVLVSAEVDSRSVKRWWTKEKVFNIVWNLYLRAIQGHSGKAYPKNARITLHCKTMYCFQRILSSTFITSEQERNWDQ